MKRLFIIVLFTLLVGCSEKGEYPPIPSWGYLPNMSDSHWDMTQQCADTKYSHVPFGVSDIGDSLHPTGKPATGVGRQLYLGKTCILASISTTVYTAPEDQLNNHYTISIQVPQADSRCVGEAKPNFCNNNPISYLVIFSRDFRAEEVGQSFRQKRMEDIINFDEKTKLVVFEVGSKKYEYQLSNL